VTSVLFSFAAIITNIENLETTFDGGEVESYYLVTRNGSDEAALDVARAVESTLLDRGIQAESIHETIEEQAALSTGFQLLFEWFMGLGLVVGIAALGVIAFRTVVERRQQIGMLRAIGYRRRLVMLSYFMESSFIALAGIGIGIGLGLPLSYNLLTSPEFTDGAEVAFQVPWVRLVTIVGVAYVVSALMTLAPAIAASRVPVAEALRYE
jgi:putative ABC transport system permease protein